MASDNDLVSKAVEDVLGTDETINLLLISKSLDNINGEDTSTDPDYGMHFNYMYVGMSGQRLLDSFNSNFHAIDAQFLAHNNAIQLSIMSNNIKFLKEENGVISYSADGETWKSLQSVWGKIGGNIVDQKDLQETLSKFALSKDLTTVNNKVDTNSNSIILLQGNISNLTDSINSLFNQINGMDGLLIQFNNLEAIVSKKVGSDNITKIRISDGNLEYTSDDTNWFPVTSQSSVEWGDIAGDIQNQADLINLINTISGGYDEFVTQLVDIGVRISTIEGNLKTFNDNQTTFNETVTQKLATSTQNISESEYDELVSTGEVDDNIVYIVYEDTTEQ